MADLTYSTQLLESLGSGLTRLGSDMDADAALQGWGVEDLAHQRVVDAVSDFNDDWDDKREVIAQKLENIGTLAAQAAKTFTEADQGLADKVREILDGSGR